MPGKFVRSEQPESPPVPEIGTLLVDVSRDQVGEFRGEWCGWWCLRPVCGGTEWAVSPEDTQLAGPEERLRAETARANARSRGELL